jgi:serine/threonine protein kinase
MINRSGQQLGNYRVIRPIGHGGFADVYLGEHVYLRTQVAIKVLQTKIAGEDDLEGFLREARTIAHLEHPHIVRVMDFGVEGQTPFLVMDYAPNGTLRLRHPKGSRIPLATIVPYVRQIASALQYAHDAKLIHRDVKPENMLLGKNDKVLLSDFGVALVAQSSRYQSTQDVIGTVAYMSPEQIQGKPRPASDQYSLAVVIYEWLSGDRPFNGSFTELCTQHMFAPPPALRVKIPDIAPGIEQVMMIALAKDPKLRFGSIRAFAHAFERASRPPEPTVLVSGPASLPLTPPPATGPTYVPVTQVAPPAQDDGANTPRNNSSSAFAVSVAKLFEMGHGEQAEYDEKVNVWRIDKQRAMAMIIGIVLCASLGFVSGQVLPPSVIFIPAFLTAVICGVLFGPWVGLVSGGVGISIYELVYNFARPNLWNHCVGFTLVGFIAGLATIITRGRYSSLREFAVAEIFGVMGILMSLGFIFYSNVFVLNSPYYNLGFASSDFINYGISFSVASLIFLPLLLTAYNRIVSLLQRRYA